MDVALCLIKDVLDCGSSSKGVLSKKIVSIYLVDFKRETEEKLGVLKRSEKIPDKKKYKNKAVWESKFDESGE